MESSQLLGEVELADAYEEAWDEWGSSGEAAAWECVVSDGLQEVGRAASARRAPSPERSPA